MEWLKLIGILVVVVGFVLKFDTMATVVVAGLVTGLVAGMSPMEILETLGNSFISNRTATLFVLTLSAIGLCERNGLKDKAVDLIKKMKSATTGRVLAVWQAVRTVASAFSLRIGGHPQFIRPLINPMAQGAAVAEAIAREKPDAVLCIGQAGGRYDLTPERVAINLDDARIPDNEGNQPIDTPIFADGAPAYFATLPIKAMVAKIREAGLPSSVSNTAGTFVCNHLMYGVLYTLAKHYPGVRGGFMHVPFIPSQTVNRPSPAPSMAQTDIARGIEAAITAIAENDADIAAVEGQTH